MIKALLFEYGYGFMPCVLAISIAAMVVSASAAEYEVKGVITQTITEPNVPVIRTTNEFTVYVKDCGWLIQTIETNNKGLVWQREVGSTNGSDIYESNGKLAFISGSGIPVELLDQGVDGHLWLLFASQCFWSGQHMGQLTPIYDWHASIGAHPDLKVRAEWELLNGLGSLPREVRYLGDWDETNGLYRITGTNSAGGVLIPSGFVFEERHVGRLAANSLVREMALRKRVEAQVTEVRAECSRKSLLPELQKGTTGIVDWRLKARNSGNHVPAYSLRDMDKWPSVEEARQILKTAEERDGVQDTLSLSQNRRRRAILLIVTCIFLAAPPVIYFFWQRYKKN